jgi:hypothetical protein
MPSDGASNSGSISGGFAGKHTLERDHLLRVGPAVDTKHNTYRMALIPLACWHIKDVRFDFDSSFVLPDAAEEMQMLSALRQEHPGAPLSVFGHADPVGTDKYNKELSGRRARAIYGMLVRREAMWEDLFSHAHSMGGDAWGQKAIRKMQDALGLPHKPAGSSLDRAMLFRTYMDKICGDLQLDPSDFLAKGADAGGKGDYQGCGEFNPLRVFSKGETAKLNADTTKRNKENAPNRRVLVYMFRPNSVVNPDRWPCPRDTEGVDGCLKRMWSDADKRRNPSDARREFETTKDTFGCRFYHRIAVDSPCERVSPAVLFIVDLHFEPAKAVCGDKVKLIGTTNLDDGSVVRFDLVPRHGVSKLKPLDTTVAAGAVQQEFEVSNIDFKDGSSFLDKIELDARVDATSPTKPIIDANAAALTVEALLDSNNETFSSHHNWSGFTMDPKFDQKIEKFRVKVHPSFKIIKMWGAYAVDLSGFGISGAATNGPGGGGWRWARVTGSNPFMPDQYHDGSKWVALPNGFAAAANANSALYTAMGLFKQGNQFFPQKPNPGGPFPTPFLDYDFNAKDLVAKRDKWVQVTHDKWTEVFQIRRKNCHSENAIRCCRYDVEVNVTLTEVTTDAADVIGVCREGFRSNAGTFFMGDPDVLTLAHETGHHMDNPDEYKGGAVDPTLNGDGAVNGIDADCIMGQNMTKVKKRHYHAFNTVTKTAIKNKYGRDFDYETVDKV